MILILTAEKDAHADHVVQALRAREIAFARFDPGQFPEAAELTVAYDAAGVAATRMRSGDLDLALADVSAVWYRRPTPPQASSAITDAEVRELVQRECRDYVNDVWNVLECAWLPAPPVTLRRAGQKASQLQLAGTLGFELPPTVITNSPTELVAFYQRHNGNIISKLFGNAFSDTVGYRLVRFTERVTPRDLANAAGLRHCPMILQAYVPKKLELRITVVGTRVFAAEIHSQVTNRTRHDWRRYDMAQTPHYAHTLPAAIERRCVELVAALGLCYGAIDMIVTPDDRYVFLEINPNGQYLWIEQVTGLPITDAICDLFAAAETRGKPVALAANGGAR